MWEWPATVVDNHDGDTITVTIDRGFEEQRNNMKLRLEGVFAPELSQPGGPETRLFVTNWLYEHRDSLVVTTVRLKNGKRELKTLERYVAQVSSAGESLNDAVRAFVEARGYPHGVGG